MTKFKVSKIKYITKWIKIWITKKQQINKPDEINVKYFLNKTQKINCFNSSKRVNMLQKKFLRWLFKKSQNLLITAAQKIMKYNLKNCCAINKIRNPISLTQNIFTSPKICFFKATLAAKELNSWSVKFHKIWFHFKSNMYKQNKLFFLQKLQVFRDYKEA